VEHGGDEEDEVEWSFVRRGGGGGWVMDEANVDVSGCVVLGSSMVGLFVIVIEGSWGLLLFVVGVGVSGWLLFAFELTLSGVLF
jgi:hypothetical protein